MSLENLCTPFPWERYSRKLALKIENPRNMGFFTVKDAQARGMRYVEGREGEVSEGNALRFYWLVDKQDGVIVDSKFQVFGQSALIGAAEVACELLVGKNYDQALRISADLIDKQVRDRAEVPAFPMETAPHLNLVLSAIEDGSGQCTDLPLPTAYIAPPAPTDFGEVLEGGYPGWEELTIEKKLAVIQHVIDEDITPYIALDGGGVELINLLEDKEVVIAYQGNCTSCFSAVGATLSYIQNVIQAKVHPTLTVTPNL